MEDLETNIVITEDNKEEMEKLYGVIPNELNNAPVEHSQNEAIGGTLEEDSEVVFNEISNEDI